MWDDQNKITISQFFTTENTLISDTGYKDENNNENILSVYFKVLMYVMYISISLIAIIGNGVVVYLVFKFQRMKTVTNLFIVNLAIGDILMAILCIPFGFISNLLLQYWPFGSTMCTLVSYSQAVSVFISAYTLVAISIDRYMAIIFPLKIRMSKAQAQFIILLIWLVALLTPLPSALLSSLVPKPASTKFTSNSSSGKNEEIKYTCQEQWSDRTQRYYYSITLMILQYFLPLSVLIYTYSRIAYVVFGRPKPANQDQLRAKSKRKMIKMMIIVVCVYSFCWLPLNTLIVVADLNEYIWQFSYIIYVWFFAHWLAMSHSAYNPLIYCWMNNRFRSGFKHIFFTFLVCFGFTNKLSLKKSHCKEFQQSMHNSIQTQCTQRRPLKKNNFSEKIDSVDIELALVNSEHPIEQKSGLKKSTGLEVEKSLLGTED